MQSTTHDKAPEMPWGLHLIGDNTSEARHGEVAVDIIAVHGLGANPDHAWVRHKDTTAGVEKDVRWLTDLLPRTFRDYQPSISARVFCFNYQSAWLGPQLSKDRLESIAQKLLDNIHNVRYKDGAVPDRPIIFIGHSFGGLVIEKAIVQANTAEGNYQYLVKLIGGVVLLGTPHQGSKSQKWGSIVANLANLIDYGDTGLMKEVHEKSMKIFDLVSEFQKIMISMGLAKTAVICFYENLPTNYLPRVIGTGSWVQRQTSSMVVEETSAVLSAFHSVVLDSDHLKLNKFPSAKDGNYVSVSSNLCRISAEAPNIIRRHRKGQLEVKRVVEMLLADGDSTKETASSHFLVSPGRVKDFIGRDGLLDQIRLHFSRDRPGPPPILILHALGGQGKSQIALEYCRKWRETYRGVFWIDTNSEMTAARSYAMIAAELMGESWIEADDSAAQIRLVKGRLELWDEDWLLVFDNYDAPDTFSEIRQLIPTKGRGHVLFTSRNRDLSRLGTLLEIPPMDKEEGVKLLLRGYDDNDILERHKDTAETIINRLGKLALAIDQAAAYIKYKRMPLDRLEDFLTTYETKRLEILKHTPRKFWEYQKVQDEGKPEHSSAFTTWELSFQQLRSGDEPWKNVEAHFLSLSAFFAPTAITESIFRHYQEEHDSEIAWLQMFSKTGEVQDDKIDNKGDEAGNQSFDKGLHGIWDPDRFWDVIVTSEELSLLQSIAPGTDQQGATFSLHPLIRDWLQLRLQPKERGNFAHEAIAALACCVKAFETRSTSLEEKTALITHIDVSMSNDKEFSTSQDRLCHDLASCDLAFWFGQFYIDRGRYHTSEELCRRMVETRRKLLSEKHPLTLRDMDNLARVLSIQCKYEEALSIFRQTSTLREATLGDKHVDTLESKNSLALVLMARGRYAESEQIVRQTLIRNTLIQGEEHPSTLMSMRVLALVLRGQRKFEEAERVCRTLSRLRLKVWGEEHVSTLSTMGLLAVSLLDQKKYEEAEPLFQQALRLSEKLSGRENPNTLIYMNYLARLLKGQLKYEEAERLFQQTFKLREKVLGREHPDTLMSMYGLAEVLKDQLKYEEAERLFQQTFKLREKVLGKEHPNTLMSMYGLAEILKDQLKYEEAERLFQQILKLREKVLGKEHPDTLMSMCGLAEILKDQLKYEEAERLFQQILKLREKVLGTKHSDTVGSMGSMGSLEMVLRRRGKDEEAERLSPGNAS